MNFAVLWLFMKVFSAKFGECGVLCHCKSKQSVEVFSTWIVKCTLVARDWVKSMTLEHAVHLMVILMSTKDKLHRFSYFWLIQASSPHPLQLTGLTHFSHMWNPAYVHVYIFFSLKQKLYNTLWSTFYEKHHTTARNRRKRQTIYGWCKWKRNDIKNRTTIAKKIYTYTKEKHASNICNYGWLLYNKQQSLVHSQGKACPIIHSDTTSPLQSWSTHTSFCSHDCKRQLDLHPPHHFAVWFAPFSWKPVCKTLHCKPFHARRPSSILWKGKRIPTLTDRQAYEWVSVSTTQVSNNASDCGYHTPLTPRSAARPGIPLVSSASLTTGSVPPLCMLVLQYLPGHPSVHCVSVLLICAFLTIEGMLQAELSAAAITTRGHSQEGPTIPHC